MVSGIYTRFKTNIMKCIMNLTGTVKVALYGASFSFTASDTAYTTTNEIGGTGYSAGGATLTNPAINTVSTVANFDADDPSWSSASFSAYHAAFYGVTPCNTLICALDFGGVQTVTGGTFSIQLASSGLVVLN